MKKTNSQCEPIRGRTLFEAMRKTNTQTHGTSFYELVDCVTLIIKCLLAEGQPTLHSSANHTQGRALGEHPQTMRVHLHRRKSTPRTPLRGQ